jgi:hypothetical protein
MMRQQYNTFRTLEEKIENLTDFQMYIRPGTVCAEVPEPYIKGARQIVCRFLQHNDMGLTTFAHSSGGARQHKLYRSRRGDVFLIYSEVGRGDRIFYLTKYLLMDLFDEDNMPQFEDPPQIKNFEI